MNLIKLNTNVVDIAGGALVGAGGGHFLLKDWKAGAMMGALVMVLAPTGINAVGKVIPKGIAGAAGAGAGTAGATAF